MALDLCNRPNSNHGPLYYIAGRQEKTKDEWPHLRESDRSYRCCFQFESDLRKLDISIFERVIYPNA